MAIIDNLTPDQQRELNSLLEKEASTRERIAEINKRIATAVGQERQNLQNLINQERQRITNNAQRIAQLKKIKEGAEYEEKIFQSISGINEHIKKQITGQTTNTSTLGNVTSMLVDLKKEEITASEADAKLLAARRETLEGIALKTIDLAKQADAHHHHSETSAQKRQKFQQSIAHLTAQEKEEAETLYEVHERLEQKLERQKALHEQMHAVMHHLPGPISEALDFTKGMVANIGKGVLLTGLLAAGIMAGMHAFLEMDEAAAKYKETTGFTNNMTKEIDYTVHHTGLEYRKMGVTMADAYDVMNELANSQSDMFHFAQGTVDSLSLMKATMGISAQDSSEIQASFEQIGGLSEATAANTQMMAAKLAEGVGVSPAEMFKDMSKSAGVLSKHMKGNVNLFIQSAAKAKMLGTSLQEAGTHAEKLLDFESGIEDELVAATFVGGQFNLSRARALAYEGDILGAQQATLDALEQSGDFTKQDYHTKMALAKAAGMEVEEIEKQLGIRNKLGKMSGDTLKNAQALIDSGVDISEMDDDTLKKKAEQFATQQRIVSQMDEFKNAIAGSVEQIGGRMLPAFQALMPVLIMMADIFGTIAKVIGFIASSTAGLVGFFGTLVTLTAMIYANKVKTFALAKMQAIADAQAAGKSMLGAVASIFSGQGKLPIIGAVIAATMVGALFAAASKASSFGDDVFSPGAGSSGYGSRTLMGPEGAIQLNNKDSVIAGTDLFSKPTQSQPSPVQTISPVASSNNNMINALISEFRGVRADMASGKIGVYMDNDKVTANITRTTDNSTRNNFALT
jgi:tRNA-binding EMAP/Myf-like protein